MCYRIQQTHEDIGCAARYMGVAIAQGARPEGGTEHPMKMRKGRPSHPVLMSIFLLSISPTAVFAAESASTKAYNKKYIFTVDTFTGRIPSWTKLLSEFRGKPGINYLEIGTFEGRSALWMLENVLTHPTARLTIIDVFGENNHSTFTSNVNLSGEANKFTILSGFSTHRIREVPFNSIDVSGPNQHMESSQS